MGDKLVLSVINAPDSITRQMNIDWKIGPNSVGFSWLNEINMFNLCFCNSFIRRTLVFHHGGFLRQVGEKMSYVGGEIKTANVDINYLCTTLIADMAKEFSEKEFEKFYWLIPGLDFKEGLKEIKCDDDIRAMFSAHERVEEIHFYVVHPELERGVGDLNEEDELVELDGDEDEEGDYELNYEIDEEILKEIHKELVDEERVKRKRGKEKAIEVHKHVAEQESDDDDHVVIRKVSIRSQVHTTDDVASSEEEQGYVSEKLQDKCVSDDDLDDSTRYPEFNDKAKFGEVDFELEMVLPDLNTFKKAITDHNIALGRGFKYVKNDKKRVKAKCRSEACNWEIYCSWSNEVKGFKINTLIVPHTCARSFKNKQATKKWLAEQLVDELRAHPEMTKQDIFEWFKIHRGIHVEDFQIYRAMKVAKAEIEGSETLQFKKLWDYSHELKRMNPGSTIVVQVHRPSLELPPRFEKMYIYLNANVQGFKAGCRPLIGLDGCFLKGYYGGQLLSALAQDGNNHFYVIAMAVVELENYNTWYWFINNLLEDIGDARENGWNFISDQHKGLKLALEKLCPGAPHRNCVLHIWRNFFGKFKNMELTKQMWKCARSSTVVEYEGNMSILKTMNENAWAWLKKHGETAWTKAYFSEYPKCDNLLNNVCEQFNSKIVRYRGKPIITMLEEIRCYLMRKQNKHRLNAKIHVGKITPMAQSRLEKNRKDSSRWTPEWIGDAQGFKFQVWKRPQCKIVDLGGRECTCRMWQLTGIPCMHAIACMAYNNQAPEDYVHSCYSTEKWRATLIPYTEPVAGEEDWGCTDFQPIEPPVYKRQAGRPKKKRRKSKNEAKTQPEGTSKTQPSSSSVGQSLLKNTGRAPRKYGQICCSLCGEANHNKRKCPKMKESSQFPSQGRGSPPATA